APFSAPQGSFSPVLDFQKEDRDGHVDRKASADPPESPRPPIPAAPPGRFPRPSRSLLDPEREILDSPRAEPTEGDRRSFEIDRCPDPSTLMPHPKPPPLGRASPDNERRFRPNLNHYSFDNKKGIS